MLKIHKYPIRIEREQLVEMPVGAKILSIREVRGELVMWTLAEVNIAQCSRRIAMIGTGDPFSETLPGAFINTVLLNDYLVCLHFFDAGEVHS